MKRGERGSCQMQMTSPGEVGRWGGGGGGGRLSSLFFPIQRAPPSSTSIVPLCDSWSWQCEGENKNQLAVQPGSAAASGRHHHHHHPTLEKNPQSQPGGPRRDPVWSSTHSNWLNSFLIINTPPKPPPSLSNTTPHTQCSCRTDTVDSDMIFFYALKFFTSSKTDQ